MTSPVTPPAVVLPSAYPALGSPNFNQEAYDAATSLPAAFTRQGEIAEATKTNADSAKESADIAAAQSSAALAVVNAPKWVMGTNYPTDSAAWSPTDKQTYRRNAPGGVSNVDPYLDSTPGAGWTRVGGGGSASAPDFLLYPLGIF